MKEALNNIYKHSEARNAWIVIDIASHLLSVGIFDDGKGIQGDHFPGNGLKNMQNRMKEIGGEVVFEKTKGTGVLLKVTIN